ncbi:hypothetical protein [Brevibacillus dissolubilis]|uniref:hypothetical protein n=1 Tax=Brevibacillus dissolubilis TaxID=1844116 RepID=UPI0011165FB7|nr:hypothetical protein [Brevibacillus dissolubilis]
MMTLIVLGTLLYSQYRKTTSDKLKGSGNVPYYLIALLAIGMAVGDDSGMTMILPSRGLLIWFDPILEKLIE